MVTPVVNSEFASLVGLVTSQFHTERLQSDVQNGPACNAPQTSCWVIKIQTARLTLAVVQVVVFGMPSWATDVSVWCVNVLRMSRAGALEQAGIPFVPAVGTMMLWMDLRKGLRGGATWQASHLSMIT